VKKSVGCVTLGCVAPLAAVVILGIVLPAEWSAESSVTIATPPERILPYLDDFHRWDEWVRWEEEGGSKAELSISGAPRGVGATLEWRGESMGKGRLTITASDAAGIRYESAIESDDLNGSGAIALAREGDVTRVTWRDEGKLPPVVGGLFAWLMNARLEDKFASDLATLKMVLEAPPPPAVPAPRPGG
jgi:hypothetical protein